MSYQNLKALDNVGLGVGVFLSAKPTIDSSNKITLASDSIISVTRGGLTFNSNPAHRNITIDGLRVNTVGSDVVDNYTPTLAGTLLTKTPEAVGLALGFGAYSASTKKFTPRHNVLSTDYKTLYWLSQADTSGQRTLITLHNALSIAGSNIKENDKGETEIPMTVTGNYSLEDQDTPPFDIEFIAAEV